MLLSSKSSTEEEGGRLVCDVVAMMMSLAAYLDLETQRGGAKKSKTPRCDDQIKYQCQDDNMTSRSRPAQDVHRR